MTNKLNLVHTLSYFSKVSLNDWVLLRQILSDRNRLRQNHLRNEEEFSIVWERRHRRRFESRL